MSNLLETVLLSLSAGLSCLLGGFVLFRNPQKLTHRLFAVLSLNLTLWALGVLLIIHSGNEATARFWLVGTFAVASFLPATFYHFVTVFPHQRVEGVRLILALLYAGAIAQAAGAFTPWYLQEVTVVPGAQPLVRYGPVFYAYALWVLLSMAFSFSNLFRKLWTARGVERRQVEHVLIGIVLSTTLGAATNLLAPAFDLGSLEAYGPIFSVLLMGMFAYAMVRYHLLDIWVIVSRTTVYAAVTVAVVCIFVGMISFVQLVFSSGGRAGDIATTVLAAGVIALVLQPLKERIQLVVDRTVLNRRYDVNRLCARLTRDLAHFVRLDELLESVAREIHNTIGAKHLRVLLVDERDPHTLVSVYSSIPGDRKRTTAEFASLLEYINDNPDPIVLKKLLHERPTDQGMDIAKQLAELEAYMCVPLRSRSGVVGILTLGERTSGEIYSNDDIVVFTTLAGPLGTAIENARLYHKLEEVNLHLARILSSMRGGVIAVDSHGEVATINRSAIEILGTVKIGQHIKSLNSEVADVLSCTLVDQRGIGDFETVIVGPDGEDIPVVMSTSCLKTSGDVSTGAMAMIHDMTQIRRLERNVQRADRLSSIGTLAAGMAHEVKNPLVSIKTFTQLLLNRYEDADFRKTFAEVVPHEVERIDGIVSRLLDFSRAKPVEFADHSLRDVIKDVLALVDSQARKANVTVETDFPREAMLVHGDEQQLHQVFLNLFLNAIEAINELAANLAETAVYEADDDHATAVATETAVGGLLGVRMYRDRSHLTRKGQSPLLGADCVRVVVSDTGCGIPPEHLDRLFNPFFTTKSEGSGLGLSVVHGIVAEHGGDIDVTSVPGEGTSFVVTLPLAEAQAPATSGARR